MPSIARKAALAGGLLLLAQLAGSATETPPVRSAQDIRWATPPPVLPPGARFAVLAGDPAAAGLITVRLEMPAGYTIAPHFHPTDEHVTVLTGSLSVGMGDVLDKAHVTTYSAGGYVVAAANMHHYAFTRTGVTIQVHMQGPFAMTYVNPADDPSRKPP